MTNRTIMETILTTLKKYPWVILILLALLACEDDPAPEKPDDINTHIRSGAWQLTYFFDDTDKTSQYSGYSFVFNDQRVVVATKDLKAVSGFWELQRTSDDQMKLMLDFDVIEPFDELNDDWQVREYTETKLVLEDVSGGTVEVDYLTFEKL
jgi:hypothetical protein